MSEHEASRTLVKSPPELWTECSDAGSLSRHLSGSFGEIKITRLDPETAVAWEGEHVSGTVRLEPSGWGTRVVLTAQADGKASGSSGADGDTGEAPATPEAPATGEASAAGDAPATGEAAATGKAPAVPEAPPAGEAPHRRLMARIRAWLTGDRRPAVGSLSSSPSAAAPAETAQPARAPLPPTANGSTPPPIGDRVPDLEAKPVLEAALDSLGRAHHRPFSRA